MGIKGHGFFGRRKFWWEKCGIILAGKNWSRVRGQEREFFSRIKYEIFCRQKSAGKIWRETLVESGDKKAPPTETPNFSISITPLSSMDSRTAFPEDMIMCGNPDLHPKHECWVLNRTPDMVKKE